MVYDLVTAPQSFRGIIWARTEPYVPILSKGHNDALAQKDKTKDGQGHRKK